MREQENQCKAVVFDMDGTLIDTEKHCCACWKRALAQFGYNMTDEQALAMRSLGRPFAPARLQEWFGKDLDYAAIRRRMGELVEECLAKEGVQCKPGAVSLLSWLREKRITTAVATASGLEYARNCLDRAGLLPYFDRVISATQVREGKPSPDVYLYACAQLQAAPGDCYAVEDSPNGVLSAYRAGCRVIMVPDQTQPDAELSRLLYAKADSLTEIKGIFMDFSGNQNNKR